MSAIRTLENLARGDRVRDALLPPCRLDGWGGEAYGEEAIVNRFRQNPMDLSNTSTTVVSSHHAAIFAEDVALIADIYEGGILRIWRLGPGTPCPVEPALGVPFDTDLYQARRDVAYRAEDHPDLATEAIGGLERAGYGIAHLWSQDSHVANWRIRPFALRAFSGTSEHAVLFAVHCVGAGQQRSVGFSFVACRFQTGSKGNASAQIVRDQAGERAVEQAEWRTGFQ